MKRWLKKFFQALAFGLAAIFLVALGLNAGDYAGNLKESVVGRLFFGEETGPCPTGMVYVPKDSGGFCIDKYEASPHKNCSIQNVASQNGTRQNLSENNCSPVSVAGGQPWVFVSQAQAQAACAKAGKRLPNDAEWYLASLNTPDKNTNWNSDDCQVNNNWPGQPGLTGSGKNCFSSFGAYDMVGNVWEWVNEEIIDGNLKDRPLPPAGYIKSIDINGLPIETDATNPNANFNNDYLWLKNKGVRGMARGGYYNNQADAGFYSVYLDSPPEYAGLGIGFRCVK